MRRKKHKHTRRAVAFYKVNYGMREPFKVRARVLYSSITGLFSRRNCVRCDLYFGM